jgi:hypothetical protein
MSTRVIIETTYTFVPTTNTIIIPRYIQRERLLLIVNVTANSVLYNFSDPLYGLASVNGYYYNPTTNTTTLTTTTSTTAMSATDKLQITVDEAVVQFAPDEVRLDPVGKIRVSTPQSLIDTDFEYGLQPTKWETLALINNRPSFFTNTQSQLTITNVSAVNGSRTITVTATTTVAAGTPILIQDTIFSAANGDYLADTSGTTFTYTARQAWPGSTGTIYDSALTQIYTGTFYTGSAVSVSSYSFVSNLITVTTAVPHGFVVGNPVYLVGVTGTSNNPNGSWIVATISSPTVFAFYAAASPVSGTLTGGSIYARTEATYIHRAFDGGISFSANNTAHNQQMLRQTRRYFRYQSGKGIQFSTNVIFRPSINLDGISSNATTLVTVVTKQQHNVNPGISITISGCNESAYNGTYPVYQVIDPNTFTYIANTVPTATVASGSPIFSTTSWYGSSIRCGMFESQNGFYLEYDGQNLYAVRRTSTYQIAGFVNVTAGSSAVVGATINGVTTKFSKQLAPGDFIVIRGMTYRVLTISSDTAMTIYPEYRGSTLSGYNVAVVSKTVDTRFPQSAWNLDRCDGTGPTGYSIDLARSQMVYIDFSWYGAGSVRFGFKDQYGAVFYAHKIVNNNQLVLAFMRSGNIPARYEIHTFGYWTTLTATLGVSDTTIYVSDTSQFAPSGSVLIENEYINYTSKTSTTFTGLTRGQSGIAGLSPVTVTLGSPVITTTTSIAGIQIGQLAIASGVIPDGTVVVSYATGATNSITLSRAATSTGSTVVTLAPMGTTAGAHTYSATAPISVYMHSPSYAPTINHWGTSVIMDGRFDDDKSYVFGFGMPTAVTIANAVTNAIMAIRIAPSVDSGVVSVLGSKELVNHMQLTLRQMDIATAGLFLVTLILNPSSVSTATTWSNVGGSSLCQYATFAAGTTVVGGETIFRFFTNPNSAPYAANLPAQVTQQDLGLVRDLGNSILGGGTDNNLNSTAGTPFKNIYPDGPDVLVVTVQNIDGNSRAIQARLSWSEAQA